jgi:hypothetical protein
MTFNEFQRELRAKGIEGPNAEVFTLIYERLVHMGNEIDNNAKALLALANSLRSFVTLHEVTQDRVMAILKREDIVKSEPNV